MYQNLAILAAFAFLYTSVSGGLARTPVNGALVFMAFGTAMGPLREGLNLESGLNDGICVPILFVFLLLASEAGAAGDPTAVALQLVAESVGIGVALGAALTWLAVRLLRVVNSRGWMTDSWEQITLPALAVACFGFTQWLGGSGFIACFVGGLCFGAMEREGTHARLLDAEGVGDTMALLIWVAFGAAVVGQGLLTLTWQVVLYAFLSLTAIRMLPVYLALAGLPLAASEKLFAGWFGPRGLASIVFAVIVFEEKLPGGGTIIDAVVATIVLSVLLHGLSANPLVAALGRAVQTHYLVQDKSTPHADE